MENKINRPYLIIPKLIQQPTWGGDFIVRLKNWQKISFLKDTKIGQSYELFSGSKLFIKSYKSDDLIPEIGYSEKLDIKIDLFPFKAGQDYISLQQLINSDPVNVLGPDIYHRFGKMHILIKFTQAKGNSFQLHIKPNAVSNKWVPKAESWYYFEKGLLTCGIKPNISVGEYKKVCQFIDSKMHILSQKVLNKVMSLEEAQKNAKEFIKNCDPWQFVNVVDVDKETSLDLSRGGIHHSWEEDLVKYPIGNVLYEVQEDVMDPQATLRSFDQGKFKNDGQIRDLQIDDYFNYLDTDPINNDISRIIQIKNNNNIFKNLKYCMDKIIINNSQSFKIDKSYCHLFVQKGTVYINSSDLQLILNQGHSCFIPYSVGEYEIKPIKKNSVILKTFITI